MRARKATTAAPADATATGPRGRGGGRAWTQAEDDLVRRVFPLARRREDVLPHFPGRSWDSLHGHARHLGVAFGRLWSAADDATLRTMWPETTRRTIITKLRRSWASIVHRAGELDITAQRWSGYLTISRASRREGYDREQLLHILAAYGEHYAALSADARLALPSPAIITRGRPNARRVVRVVDSQAVTDATEWWEALETREQAIARLGAPRTSMVVALIRAGCKVAPLDRRPAEWWSALWAQHAPRPRPSLRRPRRKGSP